MSGDLFDDFLTTVNQATNETQKREAFIALVATAYADTELAHDLALGAEYRVRFEQAGIIRRGQIDSFYGNLVIEFENNLRVTLTHALDQLRGYVAGAWTEDGSANRPYLAVATDGASWQILTPELVDPNAPISAENVALILNESVNFKPGDGDALRKFSNRLFFRKWLLKPTAGNFSADFGINSPVFTRCRAVLEKKLVELADDPQLDLLRAEWDASLHVAYGGSVASAELFIRHTYLAGLARLLVFVALERRPIEDNEVALVLNGDYFRGRQISNIGEDDFFFWPRIPSFTNASGIWVTISHQLAGYDLASADEDILKPLYESLVDPEFRHDLGEYYTPDWLAAQVVDRLLAPWDWKDGPPATLDPACGSGTFLRATISAIRQHIDGSAGEQLDTIFRSVVGVDVHPLAVIIARATYLLAIADLLLESSKAITIPVYLSNSLQSVSVAQELSFFDESDVLVAVGDGQKWRKTFSLPVSLVRTVGSFDGAIDATLEIAEAYAESSDSAENARSVVKRRLSESLQEWPTAIPQLASMAVHLVGLIRARRNTIWGFLLRNRYRPTMLGWSFDFVVGNPPWLTVGDIESSDYKELVLKIAASSGIAPRGVGEQAHTELATLFLPQAYRLFLRYEPRQKLANVALVMPRSIMNATHHRRLREGDYKARFAVSELWDLKDVTPLFNVPAAVLFCEGKLPTDAPFPGRVFQGRLSEKDAPRTEVEAKITSRSTQFHLGHLATRTAWMEPSGVPDGSGDIAPPSAYVDRFRQGAIIYPQVLFAVVSAIQSPISRETVQARVVTDPRATSSAKLLKSTSVNHLVETACCYSTLDAASILPWSLRGFPWTVILPTVCDPGSESFRPVDPTMLRSAGRVRTAAWMEWANTQWCLARKPSETSDLWDRLDYIGQFSSQAGRQGFVVVFTASGSRVFAAVVEPSTLPLPYVARDKTYWGAFETLDEAAFVCAFLNSDYAYGRVLDFMTRGLMGPRDTHKRILDVPFPLFDAQDGRHSTLAQLAIGLMQDAKTYVASLPMTTSTAQARIKVRENANGTKVHAVEDLVTLLSQERS